MSVSCSCKINSPVDCDIVTETPKNMAKSKRKDYQPLQYMNLSNGWKEADPCMCTVICKVEQFETDCSGSENVEIQKQREGSYPNEGLAGVPDEFRDQCLGCHVKRESIEGLSPEAQLEEHNYCLSADGTRQKPVVKVELEDNEPEGNQLIGINANDELLKYMMPNDNEDSDVCERHERGKHGPNDDEVGGRAHFQDMLMTKTVDILPCDVLPHSNKKTCKMNARSQIHGVHDDCARKAEDSQCVKSKHIKKLEARVKRLVHQHAANLVQRRVFLRTQKNHKNLLCAFKMMQKNLAQRDEEIKHIKTEKSKLQRELSVLKRYYGVSDKKKMVCNMMGVPKQTEENSTGGKQTIKESEPMTIVMFPWSTQEVKVKGISERDRRKLKKRTERKKK